MGEAGLYIDAYVVLKSIVQKKMFINQVYNGDFTHLVMLKKIKHTCKILHRQEFE